MLEVRDARRRLDLDGQDPALPAVLSSAELRRRTLHRQLAQAAGYSHHGARAFTVEEAIANPDFMDETLMALVERLRQTARTDGRPRHTAAPALQRAEDARARRRRLVEALQAALDGASLPILRRSRARRRRCHPRQFPGARVRAGHMDSSASSRRACRRNCHCIGQRPCASGRRPGYGGRSESDDKDPRPETEAPRARHFGTFLARADTIAASAYAGFVCDEWAEQRSSRTQLAAMAVNVRFAAERAAAMPALCVPPNAGLQSWTENRAAEMVFEAIQWMKIGRCRPTTSRGPPRCFRAPTRSRSRDRPGASRSGYFRFADLAFTGF